MPRYLLWHPESDCLFESRSPSAECEDVTGMPQFEKMLINQRIRNPSMSIEQALADLQGAVEELTATIKGKKASGVDEPPVDSDEPETSGKKSRKRKPKAAEVTSDDVRAALMALNTAKGKQAVIDVLAQFKVKKLADLAEENYAACKEAAEEAASEEAADDDDSELFE
jgi:hypothetical protein